MANKIKVLECGCVYDNLNNATLTFCEEHKEEFEIWKRSQISTVC